MIRRNASVTVAAVLISGAAYGQAPSTAAIGSGNTVTLYGDVDIGPTYVSNVGGHSKIFMDSSEYRSDKYGIRGQEYLGDGLAAVFKIEGEFFLSNGTFQKNGALNPGFTSQTFAGLSSQKYGTVTFGRQLNMATDTVCFSSACFGGVYSFHEGSEERVGYDTDNAIRYESPNFGGLKVKLMYGFTDPTNEVGNSLQAGVSYDGADFSVASFVQRTTDAISNIYANLGVTRLLGVNITSANPNITFDRLTVAGVGGAWHMVGQFRLMGVATLVRMEKGSSVASMPTYDGGIVWNPTPSNTISMMADRTILGGADWTQYTLGYVYALSKTTLLTASLAFQRASGTASYANMQTIGSSSGKTQATGHIGMTKYF